MEKITYEKLKAAFLAHERTHPKDHLTACIVFTKDSFTKLYPLKSRTYKVSSNNKAFQPCMGGYSIYASCLDGTDIREIGAIYGGRTRRKGRLESGLLLFHRGRRPRRMKKLWLRLGVTLELTEAEEQAIFSDEGTRMEDALSTVISEGRFRLDGESYIPGEASRSVQRKIWHRLHRNHLEL